MSEKIIKKITGVVMAIDISGLPIADTANYTKIERVYADESSDFAVTVQPKPDDFGYTQERIGQIIFTEMYISGGVGEKQYKYEMKNSDTGKYTYTDGGTGKKLIPVSYVTKAYVEDDNLYIFDKYLQISESDDIENEYDIRTSSVSEVIERFVSNVEYSPDIEDYVLETYKDKMAKYKHTFKKNYSGEYYWVSTEPMK